MVTKENQDILKLEYKYMKRTIAWAVGAIATLLTMLGACFLWIYLQQLDYQKERDVAQDRVFNEFKASFQVGFEKITQQFSQFRNDMLIVTTDNKERFSKIESELQVRKERASNVIDNMDYRINQNTNDIDHIKQQIENIKERR